MQDVHLFGNQALSNEQYHKLEALTSSKIEDFIDSPTKFAAYYLFKSHARPGATPAMDFGTVVHALVLEPHRVAEVVGEPYPEVAPDGKKWLRRKGSDHERWWAEAEAAREGKICLEPKDMERARIVAAAVREHPVMKKVLAIQGGTAESSILWRDEEVDLYCACRPDYLVPGVLGIDLKTTSVARWSDYAKQAVRLGYHRKQAHYLAGLSLMEVKAFTHVVAEVEWPYRVGVFQLDDFDPNHGHRTGELQRRNALRRIKQRLVTGDWADDWTVGEFVLSLPSWAHRDTLWVGAPDEGSES